MPTPSSVRLHRTLHLIDADNLLGDPGTCDRHRIEAMYAAYRQAAGFADDDHVVIAAGANGEHVFEVEYGWERARHLRRRGPDGADLALLEEATWAARGDRYDRVVIGSGDGIFVSAYDELTAAGLRVEVVAPERSLSTALAELARGRVTLLEASVAETADRPRPTPAGTAHRSPARRSASRSRRNRSARSKIASMSVAPSKK
jgi:hypothetical protein